MFAKRLSDKEREIHLSVADQLRQEGRREVAIRMLQLNMDEEQIIAATGLSKDEIKQLKDELCK